MSNIVPFRSKPIVKEEDSELMFICKCDNYHWELMKNGAKCTGCGNIVPIQNIYDDYQNGELEEPKL